MAARLDTLADAIQFLKLNKIESFVARTSSEKDTTTIFKTNPENTPMENYDRFQEVAGMTNGSFYIVEQGNRGTFRIEVKNERATPTMQGVQQSVVQGLTEEQANKIAEKKFQELMMKHRLEELEAENKELQREVDRRLSISEQFMERTTPYLGTIMPALIGKFIPQAGHVGLQGIESIDVQNDIDTETEVLTDAETNRLNLALQKWAKVDPDFLEYIEAFAEFAASGKKVMGMDYKQVKALFNPEQLTSMLK